MIPPPLYESVMKEKVAGYRAAYGSVLWFEDEAALSTLAEKNPMLKGVIPECMFTLSPLASLFPLTLSPIPPRSSPHPCIAPH